MATTENLRAITISRRAKTAVAALLAMHALLLGWSACRQSPTLDEPAQLVAGIAGWRFGRFDLYSVNPPLVRLVAALPVLAAGAETDWSKLDSENVERREFGLGIDFVAANGPRSQWLFTLARWACIPFSLIGGWICFCWARSLFGNSAGLIALGMWTFSPNILAHGQLITTDVPAASLGVAAAYSFWRWLKSPSWLAALLAGAALGLAELTKMTWILLFGLWPIVWIVWCFIDQRQQTLICSRRRQFAQVVFILVLALYVINVGYAFRGSFSRLKSFAFASSMFSGADDLRDTKQKGARSNRFADDWAGNIPVPFPRDYLLGVDIQKREFEDPPAPSYLGGVWRNRGWWYFYLYALWLKVPLAVWVLAGLLVVWRIVSRTRPLLLHDELVLLIPFCALLVAVSSQTGFSHHMRYALPALPFAFIWLSQADWFAGKSRSRIAVVAALAVWSIGSGLWSYPHTLSYFNEIAGGPEGGPRYLIHSDCDWGQDLVFLQDWLDDHQVTQPIWLAYYGNFDPHDFGVEYNLPPVTSENQFQRMVTKSPKADVIAVSVNFLRGVSRKAPDGRGGWMQIARGDFDSLLQAKPAGQAGYSIVIYRTGPDD